MRWYGLGQCSVGIKIQAKDFLVFFYTQVVGLSGTLAGLAVLITALSDALSDPVVGAWSDRRRSRWGRRHPFLVLAAVPVALTFYLLWTPPAAFGQTGLFLWLLCAYAAHQLAMTAYYVPYLALGAELSEDYEERTTVVMFRGIWDRVGRSAAGTLILLVFFRATAEYPDGQMNPAAYPRFALLFACAMPLLMWGAAWGTRNRIPYLRSDRPPPGIGPLRSLLQDMRQALQYRSFRAIFGAIVAMSIGWGVTSTMGLHMMTYFWKVDTNMLFIWGFGMTIGVFAGLSFWARAAAWLDKKATFIVGLAAYILFMAVPCLLRAYGLWIPDGHALFIPSYVFVTGFLAHFGLSSTGVVGGSMLADVADLDEYTHGRRREGIFFGVESFGGKMLTGLGSVVSGFIVDATGIAGLRPAEADFQVVRSLGVAFGGALVVFMSLAVVCAAGYDINRSTHAQLRAELQARRESA